MVNNSGEIKVFNTAKKESDEITFPILKRHVSILWQARTGQVEGIPLEKIGQCYRNTNRVKSLHLMISTQKDLIQVGRPYAWKPSLNEWNKKYTKEEEKTEHPFEEEKNDYNKLGKIRNFLDFLEKEIRLADKSATKDDDFLIESQGIDGIYSELTQNFYEMLRELEGSHEKIINILIRYNLVGAGQTEDESMSYKELEEAGKARIIEA